MKNIKGEFHIHTKYSDGELDVETILDYLKDNIDYFCITDHDYIDSSIYSAKIALKFNLKSIIGVEVSSYHNDESIHILGYFKVCDDIENRVNKLRNKLNEIRKNRLDRMYIIKERLYKYFNIDLDVTDILKKNSITRGTIGREIVKQGYPYDMEEIFDKMIGKGCPAYYPATKISTIDAIDLIHECGGLAVLAHPTLIKKTDIQEFIDMNIDGIEAIYPLNKDGEEEKYRKLANDNNLFITAGNDFHYFGDKKHADLLTLSLCGTELELFIDKVNKLK